MLQALTRHPICWGLQAEDAQAKKEQPVVYRNVCLKGMPKACYETQVNWHTGTVSCFLDASDAMNHVPFWESTVEIQAAAPRTRDEYVREAFAFLQRGHSMLEPECQCAHGLSDERALELGVRPQVCTAWGRPKTTMVCLVPRSRTRRSLQEIARELHVDDVRGLLAEGGSLYYALVQLAGMEPTRQNNIEYLHSSLCCISPVLTTSDAVVHAAQIMAPLPFTIGQEQVQKLLPFLRSNPEILLLESQHEFQIFFKTAMGLAVDDDIKALWKAEPWDSTLQRPQVLERALRLVELQPMHTQPDTVHRQRPVAKKAKTSKLSKYRHHFLKKKSD